MDKLGLRFNICNTLGGNNCSAMNKLCPRVHPRVEEDKQIAVQYAKIERKIKELLFNAELKVSKH